MKSQHHGPSDRKPQRKVLLLYIAGTVLLTNVLTIVFVRVLDRDAGPAPVARVAPALGNPVNPGDTASTPEPAAAPAPEQAPEQVPEPVAAAEPVAVAVAEPVAEPKPIAEPPVPAVARILVGSSPAGATVHAGGRKHGVTPLTIEVPADQPGRIRLSMQGYKTRSVVPTPGQASIDVQLEPVPEPAPQDVQSPPAPDVDVSNAAAPPAEPPLPRSDNPAPRARSAPAESPETPKPPKPEVQRPAAEPGNPAPRAE